MKEVLKYQKAIMHTFVWMVFFFANVRFFSALQGLPSALLRGSLVVGLHLIVFYANWFFLTPRFYIRKRYASFILFSFLLLCMVAVLRMGVIFNFEAVTNRPALREYHPVVQNEHLRIFVLSLFVSTAFLVFSTLLRIADYYERNRRQRDLLLQQNTEAELKLLKAQLNPHFLFNALNNIYALVLTRSDDAAASLMSLSQLLRYIIYETGAEKVALEKEITYLRYYLALETLRLKDKSCLQADIQDPDPGYMILPMLFIPFVENSFKHGDTGSGGRITVELHQAGNELLFSCENTLSEQVKNVDSHGGVGLANTKKRLELLYPGRHQLEISSDEHLYSVKLTLVL